MIRAALALQLACLTTGGACAPQERPPATLAEIAASIIGDAQADPCGGYQGQRVSLPAQPLPPEPLVPTRLLRADVVHARLVEIGTLNIGSVRGSTGDDLLFSSGKEVQFCPTTDVDGRNTVEAFIQDGSERAPSLARMSFRGPLYLQPEPGVETSVVSLIRQAVTGRAERLETAVAVPGKLIGARLLPVLHTDRSRLWLTTMISPSSVLLVTVDLSEAPSG